MHPRNLTKVSEFILEGVFDNPHLQGLYIVISLCLYLTAILSNSFVIIATVVHPPLHIPMYFFISNLAILDLVGISSVLPKMLENLILGKNTISFEGCVAQLYTFTFSGSTELILLTVMSYDRYLAICQPLHYVTMMSKGTRISLMTGVWGIGTVNSLINTLLVAQLDFCGPNLVQNFLCEIPSVLALSCSSTYLTEIMVYMADIILGMGNFLLVILSYCLIIITILKIQGSAGKWKAFSTCSSHLAIVGLFYSTVIYTYIQPTSTPLEKKNKTVSIMYTLVTPTLNPLIYSLRNKVIKAVFWKIVTFHKTN
ncbi:olfactory receptor 13G1-like [Gymnogyps californianus]|uniref:olfactory receptor 13G1-like n=1 Tax=Gymnogyps californianus TaxID=33616 RepID=UPI0021C9067A|nr:olfactory receptor 13G1-like [Gymnogyps californianus]